MQLVVCHMQGIGSRKEGKKGISETILNFLG